jgi:hypothetical protein
MRFTTILTSIIFLFTVGEAAKKAKIDAVFFEKVPRLPHGGGPFAKVPLEVAKKIEGSRKDIFQTQDKVTTSDDVAVLSFADDLGMKYVILAFGKDGKLQAGVSGYEKYGQCYEWSFQKSIVKTTCSGSEGGESWKYDITYDFKKMIGKVEHKK